MPKSMDSLLASLGITLEVGQEIIFKNSIPPLRKNHFILKKYQHYLQNLNTKKSEQPMEQESAPVKM